MINLIPPVKRRELQAMRHNAILVRYALISIVFLAVTLFVHFGTYLLLRHAEVTNTAQSEEHLSAATSLEGVYNRATEYKSNLAAAKALFDSSIPYPEALSNLAKTLPSGVIIDSVSLQPAVIDQPGTLTAHARDYDAAVALKDAFSNSPIAENVSISTVFNSAVESQSGSPDAGGSPGTAEESAANNYPIQVTLNITFTRELLYPGGLIPESEQATPANRPSPASNPDGIDSSESTPSRPSGNETRSSGTDGGREGRPSTPDTSSDTSEENV